MGSDLSGLVPEATNTMSTLAVASKQQSIEKRRVEKSKQREAKQELARIKENPNKR